MVGSFWSVSQTNEIHGCWRFYPSRGIFDRREFHLPHTPWESEELSHLNSKISFSKSSANPQSSKLGSGWVLEHTIF